MVRPAAPDRNGGLRSRRPRRAVHDSRGVRQNVGGGLAAPRALTSRPPGRGARHVGESECHGTTNRRRVRSNSLGQPLLGRNRLPGVAFGQALSISSPVQSQSSLLAARPSARRHPPNATFVSRRVRRGRRQLQLIGRDRLGLEARGAVRPTHPRDHLLFAPGRLPRDDRAWRRSSGGRGARVLERGLPLLGHDAEDSRGAPAHSPHRLTPRKIRPSPIPPPVPDPPLSFHFPQSNRRQLSWAQNSWPHITRLTA